MPSSLSLNATVPCKTRTAWTGSDTLGGDISSVRADERLLPIGVGARTEVEEAVPRNAYKLWTDQDETRLRELAASGASLVRATAALRRSSSSVKRKALDLGLALRGVKQIRADLRAAGTFSNA